MKQTLIAIDPDQLRKLQQYCRLTSGSIESCIAEALSEYLYVTVQTRAEAFYRRKGYAVANELGRAADLIQ